VTFVTMNRETRRSDRRRTGHGSVRVRTADVFRGNRAPFVPLVGERAANRIAD